MNTPDGTRQRSLTRRRATSARSRSAGSSVAEAPRAQAQALVASLPSGRRSDSGQVREFLRTALKSARAISMREIP